MTFDLADAAAAQAKLDQLWADVSERLHDWYGGVSLTVTIGFGAPLFDKIGKTSTMPPGLRLMPGWEGDKFQPTEAQADVIIQVGTDDRGVLNTVERDIRRHLAGAFSVRDYEVGFGVPGSRGLLGFVDGTGNPHGDAKNPVALIGDEDATRQDGSFMVFRKIVEDLDGWERQSVDDQEAAIGRRKADSAPYDPPSSTPATSHRMKSSTDAAHGDIQILRRSFP
ncbi:MAG: Dyp-type peroxidase, partial [Chloroflexi bacterium]|nr:Dyp-type peroxidase [Chloroflexota bacterium]